MIAFRVLLGQVEEKTPEGKIIRHRQGKIVDSHSFADAHVKLMIADGHVEQVILDGSETVSVLAIPKVDTQGNAVLDSEGNPIFEKEEILDGLTAVREARPEESAQGSDIATAGAAFHESAEKRAKAIYDAEHPENAAPAAKPASSKPAAKTGESVV